MLPTLEYVLDCLTRAETRAALVQTIRSPNFAEYNVHLTHEEMRGVRALPPRFPMDKPVFAPYALTGNGYCQVKVNGRKFYVHRVACAWRHGAPPTLKHEASHLLSGYPGSERDFNPNNLVWEVGPVNKTRAFCNLYYAEKMACYVSVNSLQGLNMSESRRFAIRDTYKVCTVVHQAGHCKFWDPLWLQPAAIVSDR